MVGGQAGEWAGTCGTRAQAAQQHLVARVPLPPSAAIPGPFLTPRVCPVLGSRLVGLRPGPFSLRTSLPDGQMVPSVVPAPLSPGCVPPVVRAVWRWAAHRADHSCGSHVLPGAWRHAGATSPVCTQEAGAGACPAWLPAGAVSRGVKSAGNSLRRGDHPAPFLAVAPWGPVPPARECPVSVCR